MGQTLNYDLGRLNIGRIVKVFGDSSKHGAPAKLVGATPKHAVVRIANADRDQERAWADVRDWTSHNAQPLATVAQPQPHANGKPAAKPHEPPKATPTATLVPPAATPPASPFAVYADLSARLDAAVANVAAAEEMVDQALEQLHQAKRDHQDAVEALRALRGKAAAALTAIDNHLVGTTAAPTN